MDTALSPLEHRIAILSATGMRQTEIAKKLNIHPNTAWRALRKPAVRQVVDDLLQQMIHETARLLAERLEAQHQQRQEERRQRRRQHTASGQPCLAPSAPMPIPLPILLPFPSPLPVAWHHLAEGDSYRSDNLGCAPDSSP